MYYSDGKNSDRSAERREPQKLDIVIFFETAVRKFSKIVQLGALFAVVSIPWIVLLYIGAYTVLQTPIRMIISGTETDIAAAMTSMLCMTVAVLITALWGTGPLSVAVSFAMRAFVREEPIWMISDSWDALKKNLRQSMAVMLIDIIVLTAAAMAFSTLCGMIAAEEFSKIANILGAMQYLIIIMLIIYTMMHSYIYQLMITFKLSLFAIYKNALLFALARLPINLLLTAIASAVIIVPIWFFGIYPVIVSVVAMTVGYVVIKFPMEFYAVQNIKRML